MHGIAEEVLNLHHLLRSLHLLKLDFFICKIKLHIINLDFNSIKSNPVRPIHHLEEQKTNTNINPCMLKNPCRNLIFKNSFKLEIQFR